jgi:hypothetical protein
MNNYSLRKYTNFLVHPLLLVEINNIKMLLFNNYDFLKLIFHVFFNLKVTNRRSPDKYLYLKEIYLLKEKEINLRFLE